MKLRTRILWISCIALLAASLLGDALILKMAEKSFKNEAMLRAYQELYKITDELEQKLSRGVDADAQAMYLEYYFKNLKNSSNEKDMYTICFLKAEDGDEPNDFRQIYNHTALSLDELHNMEYKDYESSEADYADYTWKGENYVIFTTSIQSKINIYRIVPMSEVKNNVQRLAGYMLVITLSVTGLTVVILFFILKHVLQPLQELNETTKLLARGDYEQRVVVRRRDEIGQLEESFNKMAEAVEMSTRSLEESERKKTLFMGNLTHELKTPMTAISGYAQTLLSTKISPENQEAALLYIYEECGRLERLSKKMMKLLELDQEEALVFTDTPVSRLFEAAEKSCEVILQDKQITLECMEHGEHFPMDLDLMTDVLINLIDNGVKASEHGGKIILKAYDDCIEVQDFGQGIPVGEQEKIMEPFYMVDKSRSRKNGGAGLGLALTAMIAKRHDVSIQIDSKEGKGTRIILQFHNLQFV